MPVILAIGSNLNDRVSHLEFAKNEIKKYYKITAQSNIYETMAVDYKNQPDFLNQLVEIKTPKIDPHELLSTMLNIELLRGRTREIDKGPRTLDIDIVFWDLLNINSETLQVPHPRWQDRSFICTPLLELPYHQQIKELYNIPVIDDASLKVFEAI